MQIISQTFAKSYRVNSFFCKISKMVHKSCFLLKSNSKTLPFFFQNAIHWIIWKFESYLRLYSERNVWYGTMLELTITPPCLIVDLKSSFRNSQLLAPNELKIKDLFFLKFFDLYLSYLEEEELRWGILLFIVSEVFFFLGWGRSPPLVRHICICLLISINMLFMSKGKGEYEEG